MRTRLVGLIVALAPLGLALVEQRAAAEGTETKERVRPVVSLKAEPFSLKDVRLLDGPFKHAMELDHQYLLSLDADRLLHVFRIAAGLPSSAKPYGGWMAPAHNSRGEFVGLYLSACAEMHASTGDERVKAKAEGVVAGLAQCQEKLGNGFLHTHPDTFTTRCEAPIPFWYQIHKVLAGLMDTYVYCDNAQALGVARRLADWAVQGAGKFKDDQIQKMLEAEHGGINEALANLYAFTGERKYLQLALRFNHLAVLKPAAERQDRLTGLHANTQIPKFIGTAREFEFTGTEWLRTASSFFWDTVVHERSYVTGGHSLGEMFTPKESLSKALACNTCETCNTYNMLKLTRHLFEWEPRAEFADYYERALYNHILASQDPTTGMTCYFVPLGAEPKCKKEYCTPEDSFWCCTGTGIESHAKYGDSIYFHHGHEALFVNLFIASELNWPEVGVRLRQETSFPEEGRTRLLFTCEQPVQLSLKIRHPSWAMVGFGIRVNGQESPVRSEPGSYAVLDRTWQSGDVVDVSMPFTLRTEAFRDNPERVAFLHGPLVLCAATDAVKSRLPFPVLLPTGQELGVELRVVEGRPSTFVAPRNVLRLSAEDGGGEVTLEPFYRLHGGRSYVVYWDALTLDQWRAQSEARRRQKEEEARLAARTVDRVVPADEQSEKAHDVRGEKTSTGEPGWRHAVDGGWFSWRMKVLPGQAQELRVKYWGGDTGGREFDILVDGKKLATQTLDNNRPGEFFEVTYPLPGEVVQNKQAVTLRFQAHPGRVAGGTFGCAVIGPEPQRPPLQPTAQ
jgi:DUF1680 family protein